jgi:hypothetical protein
MQTTLLIHFAQFWRKCCVHIIRLADVHAGHISGSRLQLISRAPLGPQEDCPCVCPEPVG